MTVPLERRATSLPPPAPARPAPWWRARGALVAALLCAAVLVPGATVAITNAASGAVTATRGHDVSYPQCGTTLPRSGSFGVVGVNGGRVSVANPCLAAQYAWAAAKPGRPALYVNTGNPGAISTFYWPQSGARDPALCTDRTAKADPGCAYDYGWHGAEDSMRIARSALGSGVTSLDWWLDVELANSWNGTPSANAANLQGAIDRLRSLGASSVGIYATTYQWGVITGGYHASNAARYRSEWASAFTPRYPMESAPLWIAGLSTVEKAVENCDTSFTGATATLAQYTDDDEGGLDGNVACGTTAAPPTTTPPTTTTTVPATTTPPTTTTTSPVTVVPPPATTTTTTPPRTTTTTPPRTTTTTTTTTPPRTATTTPPAVVAPAVPRSVVARTHPVRGVQLTWAAPVRPAGGRPVVRYAVLRGSAPGREVVLGTLACTTATCAWQDTAIVGGRLAWYQIVAIDDTGRAGPRSPEVFARGR